DLGRMFLLVRQIDLDVGGAIDHVVVGQDVAVRINDHAGAPRHVRTGRAAEGSTWFRLLLLTRRLSKRTGPTERPRRRSAERTRAGPTGRAFMISPPRVAGPPDPLALRDLDVHDRGRDGLDDGRKPLG